MQSYSIGIIADSLTAALHAEKLAEPVSGELPQTYEKVIVIQ